MGAGDAGEQSRTGPLKSRNCNSSHKVADNYPCVFSTPGSSSPRRCLPLIGIPFLISMAVNSFILISDGSGNTGFGLLFNPSHTYSGLILRIHFEKMSTSKSMTGSIVTVFLGYFRSRNCLYLSDGTGAFEILSYPASLLVSRVVRMMTFSGNCFRYGARHDGRLLCR